jgi:beta-xylosidase
MAEQWAASVFTDDDGTRYMVASNWIQQLGDDGLSFAGHRTAVAEGFLENPWLVRREGWYSWLCSENGTDAWGVLPDKSKVSAWRSRSVLWTYEESPRTLISTNAAFQRPDAGSTVDAPDGRWRYLYNTTEAPRPRADRSYCASRAGLSCGATWEG